jgi:hypothetical protein
MDYYIYPQASYCWIANLGRIITSLVSKTARYAVPP